jgi:hypothetical protein
LVGVPNLREGKKSATRREGPGKVSRRRRRGRPRRENARKAGPGLDDDGAFRAREPRERQARRKIKKRGREDGDWSEGI